MAQRRSMLSNQFPTTTPASPMTPKGGSQEMYGEPQPDHTLESKDTFRRRTTPVTGKIEQRPTMLQEILAMLRNQ